MNKFHKYILLMGGVGVILFSSFFAFAQGTDNMRSGENLEKFQEIKDNGEDKIKEKREQLTAKINQIRDEAKKKAAERIEKKFDHINRTWTNHFTNVLNRLDSILKKMESRRDKALANGQNVSAVNVAISEAQNSINSAREAVENQTKKTYVVDVSSFQTTTNQENIISQLRSKFKEMRENLFFDLKSLRDDQMKEARQSVQSAFQALSQIPDIDQEPQ